MVNGLLALRHVKTQCGYAPFPPPPPPPARGYPFTTTVDQATGVALAKWKRAKAKVSREATVAAAVVARMTDRSQQHGLGLSLGRTLGKLIEDEQSSSAQGRDGEEKANGGGHGGGGGSGGDGGLAGLGEEGMRILRWHVANIEYSTGVSEARAGLFALCALPFLMFFFSPS